MALSALRDLGLDYIPVIGLAKRLEEIFVPGNSDAQIIQKDSSGLLLLRKIRDEAHRFAISFQRNKRKKNILSSPFLSIKGIGEKKLKKLFFEFSGPNEIADQSVNSLSRKIGVSKETSKNLIKVSKSIIN